LLDVTRFPVADDGSEGTLLSDSDLKKAGKQRVGEIEVDKVDKASQLLCRLLPKTKLEERLHSRAIRLLDMS
jgi:hypothetical protein